MLRNLERNRIQKYSKKFAEGAVEKVSGESSYGKPEFFLPYRAVNRENAECTKLPILYDALHKGKQKTSITE